jgi:N-acetyl-alpha-D-muramate 1-phosphate uridylyltransferase
MQAVILAGGLGTRLLPLSERVPKAMLQVAGRPFIAWQLARLKSSDISRVLLCVGHLGEQIRDYVGDGEHFELHVEYSHDGTTPLGTAGALRRALPLLEARFLVTYGDSYLPFDYASVLRDLEHHPEMAGTLAVHANRGRWDQSNVEVAGERVVRYEKGAGDAKLDHIDYGAMALTAQAIGALPEGVPLGLDQVQRELAAAGMLRALLVEPRFYEIGSPSGLAELERYLTSSARESS